MKTEIFLLWNNMTPEAINNNLFELIAYDEKSKRSYTGPRYRRYTTRHIIDTDIPSVLYPVFREAFRSNEPIYINYKVLHSRVRYVNRSLKERKRNKMTGSKKNPNLEKEDRLLKRQIEDFVFMVEFLKKKHIAYWISTKDIDKVKLPTSYLDTSKQSTQITGIPQIDEPISEIENQAKDSISISEPQRIINKNRDRPNDIEINLEDLATSFNSTLNDEKWTVDFFRESLSQYYPDLIKNQDEMEKLILLLYGLNLRKTHEGNLDFEFSLNLFKKSIRILDQMFGEKNMTKIHLRDMVNRTAPHFFKNLIFIGGPNINPGLISIRDINTLNYHINNFNKNLSELGITVNHLEIIKECKTILEKFDENKISKYNWLFKWMIEGIKSNFSELNKRYFIIKVDAEIEDQNPFLIIENTDSGICIGASVILEWFIENQIRFLAQARIEDLLNIKSGKRVAIFSDLQKFEIPKNKSELVVKLLNSSSNYNGKNEIRAITPEMFKAILNDVMDSSLTLELDNDDLKPMDPQHSEQNYVLCTICNKHVSKAEYKQHDEQFHLNNVMNEKFFDYDIDDISQEDILIKKKQLTKIPDLTILPEEGKREYVSRNITPRYYKFTVNVLEAYQYRCAICELQLNLVEAAHIVPRENGGTYEITNGIALCHNHHHAFDRHLIIINPDYRIKINSQVVKELKIFHLDNGLNELESLVNKSISLPIDKKYYPNPEYLRRRLQIISNNKRFVSIKTMNYASSKIKDNVNIKMNLSSTQDLSHFQYDLFAKKKNQEYSRDWE